MAPSKKTPRKTGRGPGQNNLEDPRVLRVTVMVNRAELAVLERRAAKAGFWSVGAYCRRKAVGVTR